MSSATIAVFRFPKQSQAFATGNCFGDLKMCFILGAWCLAPLRRPLGQNIVCTMSMDSHPAAITDPTHLSCWFLQDELDLPVKIKSGHLGKLTLKIPWKNLYSSPVVATLEGLYILVTPNSGNCKNINVKNSKNCMSVTLDPMEWTQHFLYYLSIHSVKYRTLILKV